MIFRCILKVTMAVLVLGGLFNYNNYCKQVLNCVCFILHILVPNVGYNLICVCTLFLKLEIK